MANNIAHKPNIYRAYALLPLNICKILNRPVWSYSEAQMHSEWMQCFTYIVYIVQANIHGSIRSMQLSGTIVSNIIIHLQLQWHLGIYSVRPHTNYAGSFQQSVPNVNTDCQTLLHNVLKNQPMQDISNPAWWIILLLIIII